MSSVLKKLVFISALLLVQEPAYTQSYQNIKANNVTATGAVTGDVSNSSVKTPGSTIARTLSNKSTDIYNVLDYLTQVDSSTDFTSIINLGLQGAKPVYLPYTGTPYRITQKLQLQANSTLECAPGVVINSAANATMFQVYGDNVTIKNCFFAKANGFTGNTGYINYSNFLWSGGGSSNASGVYFDTSNANYGVIENTRHFDSTSGAVSLQNSAHHITIKNNQFERSVGFGVLIISGSNNNLIDGNTTSQNSIELVGITFDAYSNTVSNNFARNTGDNCYSVTGYNNRLIGNYAIGCAATGIYVYGSGNTITGNTILNAGSVHAVGHPYYNASNTGNFGGLTVSGNWGGAGQSNSVTGNYINDDQTIKTTAYGIKIGSGYSNWATSTAYSANSFVISSNNIYKTVSGGTSGATAPTCTSGTCSDGSVTWTYLSTAYWPTKEPAGNILIGNVVYKAASSVIIDETVNKNNTILMDNFIQLSSIDGVRADSNLTGGFTTKLSGYVASTAYKYGDMVYSNQNRYRVTNVGGTSSVAPTHTSGTVTGADGITWLWVGSGPLQQVVDGSSQSWKFTQPFSIKSGNDSNYSSFYSGAGSPEGKVTAPLGSLYLRVDGGTNSTLYIKEGGGSTSTGWSSK